MSHVFNLASEQYMSFDELLFEKELLDILALHSANLDYLIGLCGTLFFLAATSFYCI